MKKKNRVYPQGYVKASSNYSRYDFDKEYDIMTDFNWGEYDNPEDKIDAMEDEGFGVPQPCTLGNACQLLYDECGGDLDCALDQIDADAGNGVGIFPLCVFGWYEQQEIFEYWFGKNHK